MNSFQFNHIKYKKFKTYIYNKCWTEYINYSIWYMTKVHVHKFFYISLLLLAMLTLTIIASDPNSSSTSSSSSELESFSLSSSSSSSSGPYETRRVAVNRRIDYSYALPILTFWITKCMDYCGVREFLTV